MWLIFWRWWLFAQTIRMSCDEVIYQHSKGTQLYKNLDGRKRNDNGLVYDNNDQQIFGREGVSPFSNSHSIFIDKHSQFRNFASVVSGIYFFAKYFWSLRSKRLRAISFRAIHVNGIPTTTALYVVTAMTLRYFYVHCFREHEGHRTWKSLVEEG